MRELWSERQNCSHDVSQKVKRVRRLSDKGALWDDFPWRMRMAKVDMLGTGKEVFILSLIAAPIP